MNWQTSKWEANYFAAVAHDPATVTLPENEAIDRDDRPFAIMVLEDDDIQRQILIEQLNSVGLKVLSASNIAEAQVILAANKLDLAIMDVDLPDGSGLELCEAIADSPGTADLPIIVLSSISDPYLVRRTRAAGGHFFISKPYDPNVLLAMIERLLDTLL